MTKTYSLRRHKSTVTVVVTEGSVVAVLPLSSDYSPRFPMLTVATMILSDFFGSEPDAELKVRLLTRGLVRQLNRLPDLWTLAPPEVRDIVGGVLTEQKHTVTEDLEIYAQEIESKPGRHS